MHVTRAIILAAGRGTRMRASDPDAKLSERQTEAAVEGVKALIPIDRPFLDYVLTRVADAGCRDICLVTGPQHHELREYYSKVAAKRLAFQFAVQQEPLGTAHALLAADDFAREGPFLVMNSDNCYPASALRELCEADGHALVGYERDSLVEKGNIAADRVAQFAIVQRDDLGNLSHIIEKPTQEYVRQSRRPILVSMNSWRFDPGILDACRAINRSARGEFELPDAVMHVIARQHHPVRVIQSDQPVLDLSHRRDIESVAGYLQGTDVQL